MVNNVALSEEDLQVLRRALQSELNVAREALSSARAAGERDWVHMHRAQVRDAQSLAARLGLSIR